MKNQHLKILICFEMIDMFLSTCFQGIVRIVDLIL
jgi:hypothetical protein